MSPSRTTRTPKSPIRLTLGAIFAVLLLFTAACGSDFATEATDSASAMQDDMDRAMSAEEAMADDEAWAIDNAEEAMEDSMAEGVSETSGAVTTGSVGAPPVSQLPDLGRDIIYTARLELASTDVDLATRDAIQAIESAGGFLFTQETASASGSSLLVFKVLPAQFQNALNKLGSVGTVQSQSVSADDVTAIVVDLQSRITTAESSVIRLRNLLDGASDIEIIASLENQLLDRETRLEQLRGQLRSVQNQVDLATITVQINALVSRPGINIGVASYAGHDSGLSCIGGNRSSASEGPTTLCFVVTNVGDAPLTEISIEEASLGLTTADLVTVTESTGPLAPGERRYLIHEFDLDETLVLRAKASATPLDADGNARNRVVAVAAFLRLDVPEATGLPGFGSVLSSSWNMVKTLAIVFALAVVAIAPFALVALIIAPVVAFIWRRIPRRPARPATSTAASPPPPPPTKESARADRTDTSKESDGETSGDADSEDSETTVSG